MPRLAVLFVLSAASSPCPDLNLIHYSSAGLERSCRRRRDAAGYCGGSAFMRTGRMFPFGKFLGLPFMCLSGRRADCLPRMV
ncbi:hypothetical protein NEIELOOT_01528 [Neisseria elongata subsp. glycolytica ATCC 29315]|uniref:Uncharacterized protein n=1 Tax=Neisseria elongata subsp. glycolytica ATCC 29315 TaxID=546263 RepID=D4DR35_NEIEG|nr:hypothetical protein NEIELOOT_01528 [Neisseria elongata subsp. glycolytica ATCC 29315]